MTSEADKAKLKAIFEEIVKESNGLTPERDSPKTQPAYTRNFLLASGAVLAYQLTSQDGSQDEQTQASYFSLFLKTLFVAGLLTGLGALGASFMGNRQATQGVGRPALATYERTPNWVEQKYADAKRAITSSAKYELPDDYVSATLPLLRIIGPLNSALQLQHAQANISGVHHTLEKLRPITLLLRGLHCRANQAYECGGTTGLVLQALFQQNIKLSIDILYPTPDSSVKHHFIVLNRTTKNNANNISSWNADAIIIDPYTKVFTKVGDIQDKNAFLREHRLLNPSTLAHHRIEADQMRQHILADIVKLLDKSKNQSAAPPMGQPHASSSLTHPSVINTL